MLLFISESQVILTPARRKVYQEWALNSTSHCLETSCMSKRSTSAPQVAHQSPCPGCQNLVAHQTSALLATHPSLWLDGGHISPAYQASDAYECNPHKTPRADHPHYRSHHFAIIVINLHITSTICMSGHVHMNGSGISITDTTLATGYTDHCCTKLKNPSCRNITGTIEVKEHYRRSGPSKAQSAIKHHSSNHFAQHFTSL